MRKAQVNHSVWPCEGIWKQVSKLIHLQQAHFQGDISVLPNNDVVNIQMATGKKKKKGGLVPAKVYTID